MSRIRVVTEFCAAAIFLAFAVASAVVAAQSTEVQGLIKARSGDTMVLQTKDGSDLTVYLNESTDVAQYEGMLKARHKEMSMAALIPGLAVKVKGSTNEQQQFVAETVRFKGDDLKQAQVVQAGMHETKQHVEANEAAINEAVARFGQLDDYYILDELVILFGNGKTAVDSQYVPQLRTLAEKAKGIEGYMIEVKGYASVTGSTAQNQALSAERADNVSNILIQQCKIPLTRMLAPGAMGETEQVGNPETDEGQAQNRRVVVRVLQNKAIAGKPVADIGQ